MHFEVKRFQKIKEQQQQQQKPNNITGIELELL